MPNTATKTRITSLFGAGRAVLAAIVLLAFTITPAMAGDYGYYGGGHSNSGYSGGGYKGGSYNAPVTTSRPSYRSTRSYSARYRDGGYGFGWLGFRSGVNTSNGYTGPNTFIATPHRADWYRKLQQQRQWDEKQYREAQKGKGVQCGFTDSPAYCYKLMGPYPSELRIVRY